MWKLSNLVAVGINESPVLFFSSLALEKWHRLKTALGGERPSTDRWMPKTIHSLPLAQLSIGLVCLHYIHLSALFVSSYIYLVTPFFVCFFSTQSSDSVSISLPSLLSLNRLPAVINVLLPGMAQTETDSETRLVDMETSTSSRFIQFPGHGQRGRLAGTGHTGHLSALLQVQRRLWSRWQNVVLLKLNLLPFPSFLSLSLFSSCRPPRDTGLIKPSHVPRARESEMARVGF